MRELFLLAAVICFGVVVLKFCSARMFPPAGANKGYAALTPEEAKARLDEGGDVVLLDVRTREEYEKGHIPGAVCLPNEDISPDRSLPFDKDAELLVYCRSGRRSSEAAGKLAAMGYTNVSDFGGIQNWPYETTTD